MEIIDTLSAWLERPVYTEGVLLYQQMYGEGFILTMLKWGPDDHNRLTLENALRLKRDELAERQKILQESFPVELVSALDEGKVLMDERTILKERLRLVFNGGSAGTQETKEWVFRILAIRDQLGDIYGRKDFFAAHGYLPEEAELDAEQTPVQLVQRKVTLRTYLCRYQTKLDSISEIHPKRDFYLEKLQAYQSELHQVEQELQALSSHHGQLQTYP